MTGSIVRRSTLIGMSLWAVGCGTATGVCVGGCYSETCEDKLVCSDLCPGECVPIPPLDFDGPMLLWVGAEKDAPPCPERAPVAVYEGHADLDDSNACPVCECSEPACAFPAGVTASNQVCPGGGTETIVSMPKDWTGACTSPATVPSSQLVSVTLDPVTERPCEPIAPPVPAQGLESSPWGLYGLACKGEVGEGYCDDPGTTCEPTTEPPPPGFRQCVAYLKDGEPVCPEAYPEMVTLYGSLEDTRACTPCECTQTAPSNCVGYLSLYQDQSCTSNFLGAMIGSGGNSLCLDVMSGTTLRAVDATWTTNEPGTCVASGGTAQGDAKALDPKTFCCLPSP